MQHFVADTYDKKYDGKLPQGLARLVEGAYLDSAGEPWCVFNMKALADDPNFVNASAS